MNDCSHTSSLVPVYNSKEEYICKKCGWYFKVIHVENQEFAELIRKKGISKGVLKEALEEAIQEWIKTQEKK